MTADQYLAAASSLGFLAVQNGAFVATSAMGEIPPSGCCSPRRRATPRTRAYPGPTWPTPGIAGGGRRRPHP
ncbi:MAG: hypothetical protein U0531_15285 [Dehalococcoidia bacterium]